MNPIEVKDVCRIVREKEILKGISFTIEKGSFTALLGPNGSGKSTTLKICSNLIEATSGTVELNGIDVQKDPTHALIGVGCVIETPEIYPDSTPSRTLSYLGKLIGLTKESASAEAARALDIVGMSDRADDKVKGFSKGMKQRVVLAQSLIGSPSLLLLDEPTSGLDPQGTEDVNNILSELNRGGMTILMSSHMLHEVEGLCDHAIMINKGQVVMSKPMRDISTMAHTHISVLGNISAEILESVRSIEGVRGAEVVSDGLSVSIDGGAEAKNRLLRELLALGLCVYGMSADNPLKEVFLDATEESR